MNELLKEADELKSKFKVDLAALIYYDYAVKNPGDAKAEADGGLCFFIKGDYEKAMEMFDMSLRSSGGKDELVKIYQTAAKIALGRTFSLDEIEDKSLLAEHLMLAIEMALSINKKSEAMAIMNASFADCDRDWGAELTNQYRIVAALCLVDEIQLAREMTAGINAGTWQGAAAKASVFESEGKYDEARAAYTEALSLGGSNHPILLTAVAKANSRMM